MAQVLDQQCSTRLTGEEGDVDGVGAELALAKLFNVYPDCSIQPRRGGADLIVAGVPIDVKTTRYPNGHLVATRYKQSGDCDVYALLVGQLPTYEVKGFCTEAQLFAMQNIKDLGHGPTRAVAQPDLITWDEITGGR